MTDDDLDETTFPAWLAAIAAHQPPADGALSRSYPGHPRRALPPHRPRRLGTTLDRALAARRTPAALGTAALDEPSLARILASAHGITGDQTRGPVPSAGNLQALELYLATWAPGWLAPGWYHYDRTAHVLAELVAGATRDDVAAAIPSLATIDGGALCWILVGDRARVAARYTRRATRFLLLEAGALLQNLALASTGASRATVPLGGFFERALARRLSLPRTDAILAAAACG
jgi:SagB-type dehydrogenase family enzyme